MGGEPYGLGAGLEKADSGAGLNPPLRTQAFPNSQPSLLVSTSNTS